MVLVVQPSHVVEPFCSPSSSRSKIKTFSTKWVSKEVYSKTWQARNKHKEFVATNASAPRCAVLPRVPASPCINRIATFMCSSLTTARRKRLLGSLAVGLARGRKSNSRERLARRSQKPHAQKASSAWCSTAAALASGAGSPHALKEHEQGDLSSSF